MGSSANGGQITTRLVHVHALLQAKHKAHEPGNVQRKAHERVPAEDPPTAVEGTGFSAAHSTPLPRCSCPRRPHGASAHETRP